MQPQLVFPKQPQLKEIEPEEIQLFRIEQDSLKLLDSDLDQQNILLPNHRHFALGLKINEWEFINEEDVCMKLSEGE